MSDFEKELHAMFDHIWDCEIDHPVFQDTVGELMEAVIQAYEKHKPTLGMNLAEVGTNCSEFPNNSDAISRQAAIEAVARVMVIKSRGGRGNTIAEAVDSAKAIIADNIRRLPSIQPAEPKKRGMNIEQEKMIVESLSSLYPMQKFEEDAIEVVLDALPSAEPKRGRWIKLDMHRGMADHKCTACEQECYVPTCMGEPMYDFCPNCGADMRGERDDSV